MAPYIKLGSSTPPPPNPDNVSRGSHPSNLHDVRVQDSGVKDSPSNTVRPPLTRLRLLARYLRTSGNSGIQATRFYVKENVGLLLVLLSQMFLSVMNVAVKKLNSLPEPVSPLELVLVRMSITWACCIGYMYYAKIPDPWLGPKEVRWLLALRGFSGFFGLFGIYFALQYLSLSDATVLTFLSPMATGVVGALVLKEKYTYREALAGLFSLIGVVLIARPEFLFGNQNVPISVPATGETQPPMEDSNEKGTPNERLLAVGVSMLGVLGSTGAYTSIRAVGKRAHPMHMMTAFSTQCVTVTAIGMVVTRTPFVLPKQLLWLALLAQIGLFGFCAQICLTMGLQRETAGRGTMAIYSQIIFAVILERIFFHVSLSPLSVVGTIIIIASALYTVFTKQKGVAKDGPENEDISLEEGLLSNTDPVALDESEDKEGHENNSSKKSTKNGEAF